MTERFQPFFWAELIFFPYESLLGIRISFLCYGFGEFFDFFMRKRLCIAFDREFGFNFEYRKSVSEQGFKWLFSELWIFGLISRFWFMIEDSWNILFGLNVSFSFYSLISFPFSIEHSLMGILIDNGTRCLTGIWLIFQHFCPELIISKLYLCFV